MSLPRLDLLIYAHDGRGLGHASRSIAIAMACRRLFEDLKVLFVSGTTLSAQLIGPAPLDWIKLPAYATRVVRGKSTGAKGLSNFDDSEIGKLRSLSLAHLIELYRPRCVLVDHMPQGKHKELIPALTSAKACDTLWILGVRGIVGDVAGVWSDLARKTFSRYYHRLLWYGDSSVLGTGAIEQLRDQFSTTPIETGYVSRAAEIRHWRATAVSSRNPLSGVVAIPWIGEKTADALAQLADALDRLGESYGMWRIFLPEKLSSNIEATVEKLQVLKHCEIKDPADGYLEALSNCRTAVIYGGYNSLTDLLFTGTPALVLLRAMQDREQQAHVRSLIQSRAAHLILREEDQMDSDDLVQVLEYLLTTPPPQLFPPDFSGAEKAAEYLRSLLPVN